MQLELTIARTEAPPAIDRSQRWNDARGRLFAWSSGCAERGGLEVPGTGVFRFESASNRIVAFVPPRTDRARLEAPFHDLVIPLALQTRGWHALHASAVSTPRGVVCLAGRSGAGKSTLARAWIERGSEAWADDTLVFRVGEQGPETIRPDRRTSVSGSLSVTGDSRRLQAVVVLEPAAAAIREGRRFEQLRPAAALDALLPHALCLDAANADLLRGLFRTYSELVNAVPVHRFRYRRDTGEIRETARRIARGVSSSRATRSRADRER